MLSVIKAYPVVDHVSFSEAVCVVGITFEEPRRWVRLFPLDFRGLERARQFRKYEAISLSASKSSKDTRPDGYAPVLDSIVVGDHVDADNGTWRRRLAFFDSVEDGSMCAIQRSQKANRQSLGVSDQSRSAISLWRQLHRSSRPASAL